MQHHINSPSTLARRVACPRSMALESLSPPSEGGADAEEGRRLHEEVAECLRGTPPAKIAEEVLECLAYARSLSGWGEDGTTLAVEEPLVVRSISGVELTRGTPDLVLIGPRSIHVVDWKFGRGEVQSADGNLQLIAYALGVCDTFHGVAGRSITAHIVQPRLNKCSSHTYEPQRLAVLRSALADALSACESPHAPTHTGAHCHYCRARLLCPAIRAEADAALDRVSLPAPVATWRDDDIARFLDGRKLFQQIVDAVEDEARARIMRGELAQYTLVPGRVTARISDAAAAWEALRGCMTPDEYISACAVSRPQLLQILQAQGRTKKDAETELSALLAGCVEQRQAAPTLRRAY